MWKYPTGLLIFRIRKGCTGAFSYNHWGLEEGYWKEYFGIRSSKTCSKKPNRRAHNQSRRALGTKQNAGEST